MDRHSVISTEVGDFIRPLPEAVELEDWTNFDLAWVALSAALCGLPHDFNIPLSDLEVQLLCESHTDRRPCSGYEFVRGTFPEA